MGLIFALGIVTPVLGQGGADRALERAKKAKKIAKTARETANDALVAAQSAGQQAQRANDRLDAMAVVSAQENGLVTTTAPQGAYEALGGPSVQVTVPASGLIEVWAQVDIRNDDGGTVALFEDGQEVPDISDEDFCGDDSALIETEGGGPGDFDTYSTPALRGIIGCNNTGAPSPVLLERPPGTHTYELRYSECQCGPGPGAEFQNRILRVGPRP